MNFKMTEERSLKRNCITDYFNEGIKLDKCNRSTVLPDKKTKLQNVFNNKLLLGMNCLLPPSEKFLKYDILQKLAENYDIHLESLKSEFNLLSRTIQQYELKNNIKINNLIQMTEMISIYKLAFIEFYKLCAIYLTMPVSSAACKRTFIECVV